MYCPFWPYYCFSMYSMFSIWVNSFEFIVRWPFVVSYGSVLIFFRFFVKQHLQESITIIPCRGFWSIAYYWDIITFERFLGVQRGWNFMCYLGLRLEKSVFFDEKNLENTLFLGKNGLEFWKCLVDTMQWLSFHILHIMWCPSMPLCVYNCRLFNFH